MRPLIRIGSIFIPSYALMVLLGAVCYVAFLLIILYRVEKKPLDVVKKTLLVSAISFVSMYLGALFFDALFHSVQNGYLSFGGITWEGGVLVGFTVFPVLTHLLIKR